MDITPTERTIVEYSLTLSAADADLALSDPFSFGEKVRESLLPHLPVSVPVRHKPTAAQQITIGKNGNGHKRGAKAPKAAKGTKLPKAECPECGKSIAQKFLSRHLLTKHTAPAAASASSPA